MQSAPFGRARLPAYIPELDGLRGIAILTVVAFHLRMPFCSLGWAGVFLFFVLSGFLITGILLDTKDQPHYFRNFYARRSLRIFPIYYLSLLVLTSVALYYCWPVRDIGWYLLYFQNYLLGVNEFNPSFPSAFNHTWSLAVEEQFYLLWPLVIRYLSRRVLLGFSVLLLGVAISARFVVASSTGSFSLAFTPLVCVVDSLVAGAIVAILLRSRFAHRLGKGAGYIALAIGGAASLIIIYCSGIDRFWGSWMTEPSINHLLFTTMAVSFSGLIIVAIDPRTYLASLLRMGVLRHIGKISYGLYIYHWPLLLLLPLLIHNLGFEPLRLRYWLPIYLAVTYFTALTSWCLIEKRINFMKKYFLNN